MGNRHKKITIILILIVTITAFININAYGFINDENRNFKRITTSDGLSQSRITAITQDSKGYMWIGTNDGLNKYNGSDFETYKYDFDEENTITGNLITDIKEDKDGNIWVGTAAGLNKINPLTRKITRYLPDRNGCNISNYYISSIFISKDGDILVGTDNGLNIYNKETDNFRQLYGESDDNNSLSDQEIQKIAEDINGDLWIGTKNGLNKINNNTGKITKYFSGNDDKLGLSNNDICTLYADEKGYLWVAPFYGDLIRVDLDSMTTEVILSDAGVREVLRHNTDTIWITTDRGLKRFDEESNLITTYKSSIYNTGSIISNDTWSICEDSSGTLWIGTRDGISLFNPEYLFNYYKLDPFDTNSLSSNYITGIYEDNEGLLWVGTLYDGINIIDRKNNIITRIDATEDYSGEPYIKGNEVRQVTGIDDEVWIATYGALNKYDKTTGKIMQYELPCNDVKQLSIDSDGLLWIGTSEGLFSFDRKSEFTEYSNLFNDAGITNLNFSTIHEDSDGIMWLAGHVENGLVRFNKKTNEIKVYSGYYKNKNENERIYNRIRSINSDDYGNIWIGAESGLIRYKEKTTEYKIYTETSGLPNNYIHGILVDNDNNLWISTNYGLSKYDIKEDKFTNYDSTDGIQGNEFSQYAYHKSKSGEMFFGGVNGLTTFRPEQIREKTFVTSVQIEDILSNTGQLEIDSQLNLNYKNNQLTFKFFIADYSDTSKVKYAYKLTGVDEKWKVTKQKRSATYTNLNPGKYTFEVAARNSGGVWSEPTIINIDIESPPWRSPIAYIIYILIAILILYIIWNRVKLLDGLVKQRTVELNNKLYENKELYSILLEQEKYKNNYFINLSHELRTPLNIISSTENLIENLNEQDIQISKVKMRHYMKTIKRNCERLVNLIDNIINTSKIESGHYKLNIKEHDIVYLVEEIALSMNDLIESKGIKLVVDPYIEEKIIECDALEIERVIINLISNAIKFTKPGGKIQVNIWSTEKEVEISVTDSGIGIDSKYHQSIFNRFSQAYSNSTEEYGGSGLGLTLSKQLIELHGGVIWVESELGKGSKFIIILPLKQCKN